MHRERPILCNTARPAHRRLARMLLGQHAKTFELPLITDLTACVTSLAKGVRRKALLPLEGAPVEFALLRRGDRVLVSCYGTGSAPVVHQWDRPVGVAELLEACGSAAVEAAQLDGDTHGRRLAERLAERALRNEPISEVLDVERPLRRRKGGEPSRKDTPLAFGYEVALFPGVAATADRSVRSDLHALLFDGTVWAYVRGRRIVLARGPVMLAVQRMVDAVRALVDAWDAGRPANVRLRSGAFRIGVRLDRKGEVTLSFATADGEEVTAVALDVPQATLPILRLTSELLRALVSVDRSQSRNLRVRVLRDEVRMLRRAVRSRESVVGFVNADPDRLRSDSAEVERGDAGASPLAMRPAPSSSLRFAERWRFELDGMDASSTFVCGDRLVISTPRHSLALCRDRGEMLWARDGMGASAWMAGKVLLRVTPDGNTELCDVEDGEPFAHTRLAPRSGAAMQVISAGGGGVPPVAIATEGPSRIVAIDLRTGELRWRFGSSANGAIRMHRAGRVLLVACGDAAIHALDVATGEVVWRFGDRYRFTKRPTATGDLAVAVGGEHGGEPGALYGLDLYSGRLRWRRDLPAGSCSDPVPAPECVLIPVNDQLRAYDSTDGSELWSTRDPGVGAGGAAMPVDADMIVNAPCGRVGAVDLRDGAIRWSRTLDGTVDEPIPQRLDPVLRGGALFVPAAKVHVLRPSDGAMLGDPLPCNLVPDLLRVDERGWVYVVEETGQLVALAPVPRLRLIPGGAP